MIALKKNVLSVAALLAIALTVPAVACADEETVSAAAPAQPAVREKIKVKK